MTASNTVVAVFANHEAAEDAIKHLARSGIDMKQLSALGASLYSVGIQKDSIVAYEAAIEADGFLVMAKGSADDLARAKAALSSLNPSRIDGPPLK